MPAKLISYSQNRDGDSLLEQIAFAARVSNPENQHNKETCEKLVRYLIKEKHWSPLEMVSACLEIEVPRDIARQILRHRSFSFQEFSQRYAVATDFTTRDARTQDLKNRQNSIDVSDDEESRRLNEKFRMMQMSHIRDSKARYQEALDLGIAKEQARALLPEGLTMSRLYMNGTLRSWVHYIDLRSANGTQKEHIEIARECAAALQPVFPMINELIGNEK
jgi:thymidylate synthase (FAD)